MTTVCCVCNRVKRQTGWVDEVLPAGTLPSHGYCPDCASVVRVEIVLMRLRDLLNESRSIASWSLT